MKLNRDTLKQSHHEDIEMLLHSISLIKAASISYTGVYWTDYMDKLQGICERKLASVIQGAIDAQERKTLPKVEAQKAQSSRPATIPKSK